MKVTVQNGAAHGLSRRDVETIIPLLPNSWATKIAQIVLYRGQDPGISAAFYPKRHTLGLFWPGPALSISKAEGLEELLVAMSVISERGELPVHLSKSLRERHAVAVSELRENCLDALRNAA